jgi:hypothetical protein
MVWCGVVCCLLLYARGRCDNLFDWDMQPEQRSQLNFKRQTSRPQPQPQPQSQPQSHPTQQRAVGDCAEANSQGKKHFTHVLWHPFVVISSLSVCFVHMLNFHLFILSAPHPDVLDACMHACAECVCLHVLCLSACMCCACMCCVCLHVMCLHVCMYVIRWQKERGGQAAKHFL